MTSLQIYATAIKELSLLLEAMLWVKGQHLLPALLGAAGDHLKLN